MGNVMCCGKREKNEVGANLKNSPRGEVTSTPLADFQTINDIEDRSAVTPYDNNREGRTEDSSHTRTSLKRPTNKTIVLDQGQGEASPSTIMNKLSSGKGIEQVTKQAKLYVRIFLDGYESIIKNTEDLGVSFKPLLEINVEGHLPYLVVPQNPLDNEELEKIINAPDNDVSMNNVSQNNIRNIIGEKENRKNFAFKVAKSFDILEEHIHSDINLVLKNEVIGFSNRSGQVEAMSNMPPEVIIGTSRVNVYKLQSKLLDQFFEGHLEFKHKGNNTVGFLKVNIAISKNPINDEEEIEKAHKDQIYENEEKTDKRYIWSNKVKQFSFLHPEAFKLFNATEEHIELANKIPLFRVCFDFNMETIKDLYLEARQTDNHLAVFQILMLLKRLAGGYNFSYIEDFFRHLGEEERYDFLPYVLSIAENNFYVLKQVVKFVCYHLKYIKESKVICSS